MPLEIFRASKGEEKGETEKSKIDLNTPITKRDLSKELKHSAPELLRETKLFQPSH